LTRADVTIAFTLISITVLSLFPLFLERRGDYTPVDVRTVLAGDARRAISSLQHDLGAARRIFGRTPADIDFLFLINTSSAPAPMEGSRLPAVATGESEETGHDPSVGNSLFFAFAEKPLTLTGMMNGLGMENSVGIDCLTFERAYLALRPDADIAGLPIRDLWAWKSTPYVDGRALFAITDIPLRNNVITALTAQGFSRAVDLSASASNAFYTLSPDAPWIRPDRAHRLQEQAAFPLTDASKRTGSKTLLRSVSPNTGGTFTHAHPVPQSAEIDGDFPSGFETRIRGAADKQRISARLVLAAVGSFKGIGSYEAFLESGPSERRK
jgi:hypothetical protein